MPIDRIFREIKTAIEEGGQTAESLVETYGERGVDTVKKLNNQIKLINAMGFYPMADEDGVFSMITEDEFDAMALVKEEKKAEPKFTKDPHNKLVAAKTKLDNKLTASSNAVGRYEKAKDDVLLKLKSVRSELDYQIAKIELLRLKQKLMAELAVSTMEAFDDIDDLDAYQAKVKADAGIVDAPAE